MYNPITILQQQKNVLMYVPLNFYFQEYLLEIAQIWLNLQFLELQREK